MLLIVRWCCLSLMMAACGADTNEPLGNTARLLAITPSSAELVPGQQVTFKPIGFRGAVLWRSSHPHVATVSDGVATGVAAGTAVITARESQHTTAAAAAAVVVNAAPAARD